MALTQQQIDVAVEWWTKALARPKFDTLGSSRGSEGTAAAAMAEMCATLSATNQSPRLPEFAEALRRSLASIGDGYFSGLHVDYGPEGILADARDKSGFTGSFPWKTHMYFSAGGVTVSCGYGAPEQRLL